MTTSVSHSAAVSSELQALREYAEERNMLAGILNLLAWDERTMMPRNGGGYRARQKGMIASQLHQLSTSDELHRLISAVEDTDPDSGEARVMRRAYDQSTKLPSEFVREATEAASHGTQAWEQARAQDDFAAFEPHLTKLLDIARRRAEYHGYETEPWDALHDHYEEGMTAARLEPLLEGLREPIKQLIDRQPAPDVSVLQRHFPLAAQQEYNEKIVSAVGYDMQSGRIDSTVHPFQITTGMGDVRLTTRYDENWLPGALFSTLHEAGHGIYEQGFQRLELPATVRHAPGLGMHESQSRMYENIVGRSLAFWKFHFSGLQEAFPDALADVTVEQFHAAVNVAERSLIRVEADELTYNLHIGLRFELERAMVNGDLAAKDLPDAWRDAMKRWLGIEPTSDRDGCIQDVHWSGGAFGYFPTYTLGNVYSCQFMEAYEAECGSLEEQLGRGDLSSLQTWLDDKIYRFGKLKSGIELVRDITGNDVDSAPLVRYLTAKFGQ